MRPIKIALACLFLFILGLSLYRSLANTSAVLASSSGPPPSRTNAPPEGTCALCHFSYVVNDPSGGVTIDGLPGVYTPGEPIDFSVTVFQDGTEGVRKDWGFELTVIDDANRRFAGTLITSDAVNTKIIDNEVEGSTRYYIEQTAQGSYFNPQGSDNATWTMTWMPPEEDIGSVTFYVAANAGNGDFTPLGDFIFTANQSVAGPGSASIAGVCPASKRNFSVAQCTMVRPAGIAHVSNAFTKFANGVTGRLCARGQPL